VTIVTRNACNALRRLSPSTCVLHRYGCDRTERKTPRKFVNLTSTTSHGTTAEVNGITGESVPSVEYEFAATGARYFALLQFFARFAATCFAPGRDTPRTKGRW